jgi:adenine-specific DNA-methyltransferase
MATLHFKGKSAVWNHHLSVPYQTLDAIPKMSHKGKDADENLIIEGDNLVALKSLLPKYQGRVKCIYIDPPYNTGNEGWVYNDNVNNPLIKEWMGATVGKEGEDLTRHDKWLCLMTPRLKLLRELLADDGVIFVSIDDNEMHNLRQVMSEAFGEENFVTTIIWEKKYSPQNDAKWFSDNHDYVVCFAKNKNIWRPTLLGRTEEMDARYINPDNDPKGAWKLITLHAKSGNKTDFSYTFQNGITWKPPSGTFARFSADTLKRYEEENKIWFGKDGKSIPSVKNYLAEVKQGVTPLTLWRHDDAGHNHEAKQDVKDLFGGDNLFDTPKPVRLLKRIIQIGTSNDDDIVLDSFAGSGTTAQAVLEMNKEDGGNRKFILVQIPESTPEDSAAYQAGYKSVQEITQARVSKVIERDGLDVGFTYYKLGKRIDAESILGGDLPTYEEFAKYVYYLATGKNFPEKSKVNEKKSFVGNAGSDAVFLIYEQDFEKLKGMALTLDIAKKMNEEHSGRKIVYAPACFLDEEHLEQYNITFVGIPFNLFERK